MDNIEWPDPTSEMLEDPTFNAIWDVIKTWDINVPEAYEGYCGSTGNHVVAIMAALENNIHTKSIPGDWETPQKIMTDLGLVKKEETNGKSTTDGVSEIHPPKQIQSVAE